MVKNVETVLESMLFELHQSKQENHNFRKEVTSVLESLQINQNAVSQSISNVSSELSNEVQKYIS